MADKKLFTLLEVARTFYDDNAIIQELRQNPYSAARKYYSTYCDGIFRCYPLGQAIRLKANIAVVEAIYNSYPPAVQELHLGQTALHIALIYGSSPDVIEFIFNKWPAATRVKNNLHQTPLHIACDTDTSNQFEVVRLLLNSWLDALKERNHNGQTPLHVACLNAAPLDILSLLLDRWPGATKMKCYSGMLPFDAIFSCGRFEQITFILNAWPHDIKEKDDFGRVALHHECFNEDPRLDVLFLLLEKWPEATKEIDDWSGMSPLDVAFHGKNEIVHTVLSHVSKMCSDVLDNAIAKEIMTFFSELGWQKGILLLLDRYPSASQDLIPGNEVLPDFVSLLGRQCKIATMWYVIVNKQDILTIP